jgi:hypothetical protein
MNLQGWNERKQDDAAGQRPDPKPYHGKEFVLDNAELI